MKVSKAEIDWIKISNLIIRKLQKRFSLVPVDEIEASSFVGMAVAKSLFDKSKSESVESWLYHVGYKRTIDDLRERRLIDRVTTVNKQKEKLEANFYGQDADYSIFDYIGSKDQVSEMERKDFWKEVIKCLSREEKLAILLYYQQEKQMKEVSVLLHFTEGRVSQIIKEALLKIKKRFEENELTWTDFFS